MGKVGLLKAALKAGLKKNKSFSPISDKAFEAHRAKFKKDMTEIAERTKKMAMEGRAKNEATYGKEAYKRRWERMQKSSAEKAKETIKKYRNIRGKDFKWHEKSFDENQKRMVKNQKIRTAIIQLKRSRTKYEEMYK